MSTCILISGYLAYVATVVAKFNIPGCWCQWCSLLSKEWSDEYHSKGMLWTIDLMKKIFK